MVSICKCKLLSKKDFCLISCFIILIIVSFIIGLRMNISSNIKIQLIKNSSIFKLAQQNLSNQTNITTIVHRKPFESYICNNRNINRFPISSTTPSNDSFDIYRKISLEKYCNIVPIPQHKWFNAQTYTENEIAFVIFTSSKFYHTRATATRDTWLSRITNYYFLSATPYPYLPVTVISDAGENKLSNVKKLFYGLQIIYQQQMNLSVNQRQKWFYIAGCDTFIIPYHLLKRLDGLDYRKPILLGGHTGRHTCPRKNGGTFIIEFPSGGAGFFFSIKLLEIMQPHLTNYVENIWPRKSDASDVALTCLAIQLGVKLIKKAGFWAHPPAFTLAEEKRSKFHNEPEPNNFHYIKPDEMYALDEFYIHQHIDRLIHDENWDELIKFARRFVTSHYELLRKKRRECPLPNRGNKTK